MKVRKKIVRVSKEPRTSNKGHKSKKGKSD